jgi:tetratricopeptide (TPR) repeat protein
VTSIIGRDRELALVDEVVARGLGGQGALVLLSGEPGIGKTRLADHAARSLAERGAAVVWGRCWEAGGAPAYWPWIQVFRALGEGTNPFGATETGEAPADARFRTFDVAVRMLMEAARERPLGIVLDDLHSADVPSLLVLQLLARGLRGSPVVVVGTYRDAEARQHRDVGPLLAKIAREGDVLPLAPLGAVDVAEWLRRDGGEESRAAEVHRLTEGNPLFVQEILRLGGTLGPSRLPDGLGAVLDEHLARVSPETRSVLECAAVLGREFAPAELARVAGVDAKAVAAALSEAEGAELLSSAAQGRRTFVHMLVRDRLVEELSPSRHAELHCRAGETILAARADLVSAAHHFIEGHTAGSIERVLETARNAAERALLQLAFEGAVELGERGLALVEGHPPTRESCALAVVVAEAHLRAGALAIGKERCIEAARVAKALGASDLLARSALAYGAHFTSATVDGTMVALLEDALAALESHDHPIRARVMARLAAALVPPSPEDLPRIMPMGREAIAMARRLNDRDTLLYALQFGASAFGYQLSAPEVAALLGETVLLARQMGNRTALVQVLGFSAQVLLEEGRRSEADAAFAEFAELLSHFPQPQYQWRVHVGQGLFAALDGDFAAAHRAGEDMRRVAEGSGVLAARVAWAIVQIALSHAAGEPASILPSAPAVLEVIGQMPTLLPYTAWVLAATGRPAEARAMLHRVSSDVSGFPWLIAAADAAVVLGDAELAGRLYAPLAEQRFAHRIFWGPVGTFCLGPTPRTLGDLAMILGRFEIALRHYDDAIEICERVGSKPLLVLSHRGREAALAKRGTDGAPSSPWSGMAAPDPNALASSPSSVPVLRREGDVWAIELDRATTVRLKDSKGLRYLERLLGTPGQEVHVLELVGSDEAPADAGAVLDPKAKNQYKKRLEDLRDQVDEASRHGDLGRARRAEEEIDAIAEQLAGAVGLGGRDRKAASNVERARINVQRRLRDAIDRISELHPALGRHLEASIRTGTYCAFLPP